MATLTAALRSADLAPSDWLERGDRRAGRRHGELIKYAQRRGVPLRALGERMAAFAGLSGLPSTSAADLRSMRTIAPALHPDMRRPGTRDIRTKKTPSTSLHSVSEWGRSRTSCSRRSTSQPARHPPRHRTDRRQRRTPTNWNAPLPTSSRRPFKPPVGLSGSGVSRPRHSLRPYSRCDVPSEPLKAPSPCHVATRSESRSSSSDPSNGPMCLSRTVPSASRINVTGRPGMRRRSRSTLFESANCG